MRKKELPNRGAHRVGRVLRKDADRLGDLQEASAEWFRKSLKIATTEVETETFFSLKRTKSKVQQIILWIERNEAAREGIECKQDVMNTVFKIRFAAPSLVGPASAPRSRPNEHYCTPASTVAKLLGRALP